MTNKKARNIIFQSSYTRASSNSSSLNDNYTENRNNLLLKIAIRMSLAAEVAGARSPRACLSRPTSPVHLLPHPLRFLLAWRLDIARLSSNWKEFGAIIPPAPCARDPLESWEIDNTHRWKISCGGRRPAQRRTSGTSLQQPKG